MNISKQHIPIGKKRTGFKVNPTKITVHSTGNTRSTAQNERDYLTNPSNTNSTGYHYVVGDNVIIEIAPPNERMYHAGNSVGNNTSIGIEMVETGNRQQVIKNTVELTKYLQKQFNISNSNVVRHFDWTKKNCPRALNYNNWQGWWEFKEMLNNNTNSTITPSIIRLNDRGSYVRELQSNLHKLGYKIDVDGIFGNGTKQTVENFQSKNGLSVDGIVGKNTQDKIKELLNADMNKAEKSWQQEAGEKAIDNLAKEGLIANADDWKARDLENETTPLWLFFEMINRMVK